MQNSAQSVLWACVRVQLPCFFLRNNQHVDVTSYEIIHHAVWRNSKSPTGNFFHMNIYTTRLHETQKWNQFHLCCSTLGFSPPIHSSPRSCTWRSSWEDLGWVSAEVRLLIQTRCSRCSTCAPSSPLLSTIQSKTKQWPAGSQNTAESRRMEKRRYLLQSIDVHTVTLNNTNVGRKHLVAHGVLERRKFLA